MTTIKKRVIDTITKESKGLRGDRILEQFIEANKNFDELVNKGLIKKRGNQLMTLDDSQVDRYIFNANLINPTCSAE